MGSTINGQPCPMCVELLNGLSAASEELFVVTQDLIGGVDDFGPPDHYLQDERLIHLEALRTQSAWIRDCYRAHCSSAHHRSVDEVPA